MTSTSTVLRALLPFLAASLACAGGSGNENGEAPAAAAPDVVETPDTAAPHFTPISLPDSFPAEFPIPPGSVPVGASVERKSTGTLASIELLDPGDGRETVGWFRGALSDLGWVVTETTGDSTGHTLQADRGESYVAMRVAPTARGPADDDRPGPWLYIEAEVWTVSH